MYMNFLNVNVTMFFFFFFQAEDGIRDFHVTGVQTCALPIWTERAASADGREASALMGSDGVAQVQIATARSNPAANAGDGSAGPEPTTAEHSGHVHTKPA